MTIETDASETQVLSNEQINDTDIQLDVHGHIDLKQFARDIEQMVLHSLEVIEIRKDAKRLQFIADDGCEFNTWVQEDYNVLYRLEWNRGEEWQTEWYRSPREAIDAVLEEENG